MTTGSIEPKYGLVLSGGGIKFATHAGVVSRLAQWKDGQDVWLDRMNVMVGTSAGALYSAFIACGYSTAQVVFLAELFAQPELKDALFQWNWDGAAAMFLRHDIRYMRGLTNGFGVQSLLETVLHREIQPELARIVPADPGSATDAAKRDAVTRIHKYWQQQISAERNADYYKKLLNFGELKKNLFIISANAFTGQKTVFCCLPDSDAERDQLDESLFAHPQINYLNGEQELEKAQRDFGNKVPDLKFKRFDTRVYRQFDASLYGRQLPVALAVRASISMPAFFEPAKIFRKIKEPREFDFFLDGAVDEDFGLSVAANPNLGRCTHILGVSLGNLGYRLPDAKAVGGIPAILNGMIGYMGDALGDAQRHTGSLGGAITIIDAMTRIEGNLTQTDKIKGLVTEGQQIADDFRRAILEPVQAGQATDSSQLTAQQLFRAPGVQQIYLSPAALAGTQQFLAFKAGKAIPKDPRFSDVWGALPVLWSQRQTDLFPRLWWLGYVMLLVLLFGALSLVLDVWAALFAAAPAVGWGSITLRFGLSLVAILGLRVLAYKVWYDMNQKEPHELVTR